MAPTPGRVCYKLYLTMCFGLMECIVPDLVSVNTSLDFDPFQGPTLAHHSRSFSAPLVSHGFMFSNLIDTAYLFGGKQANDTGPLENNIWKVSPSETGLNWSPVSLALGSNGTEKRPYRGVGCNVPDLQRGYYLGGVTEEGEVLHWLHVFDFQTETLIALPVPDYVPVVNQSMVYINTGTRSGALVALGGYIEREGNLTLVTMPTSQP